MGIHQKRREASPRRALMLRLSYIVCVAALACGALAVAWDEETQPPQALVQELTGCSKSLKGLTSKSFDFVCDETVGWLHNKGGPSRIMGPSHSPVRLP